MRSTFLLFLFVSVQITQGQRCPPRGELKMASSRSDCVYLQCYNGRGHWCDCPQGQYFVEQKQCCVYRSSKSGKSSSNSGSSNGYKDSNNGGGSKGGGGDGGGGGGGGDGGDGGDNGVSVDWDHHWRRRR